MTEQAQPPVRIWAFHAPDVEEDNPGCTIVAGERVMHGSAGYTLTSTIPANMLEAQQRITSLQAQIAILRRERDELLRVHVEPDPGI